MAETIFISGTEFRVGAGKFDARKRYLRNGNTLQNFPLCSGKTLDINNVHIGSGIFRTTLRYSVDGYIVQTTGYGGFGGSGSVSAGSYDAPFTKVTT